MQRIESVDILIIGAGPSGSVAAAIAHKHGHTVKVIERSRFPRFVIGESLLPKCMEDLEDAGFLDAIEKRNYQKKFGVNFLRNGEHCMFKFSDQFTKGWNWTWQVPRADFDKVLTDELICRGVDIAFESSIKSIEFEKGASVSQIEDKRGNSYSIKAKYIVDASGYGRVLPRMLDLECKPDAIVRKAIFTHLSDSKRPSTISENQITILIHKRDVWMWVIPFSTGISSIGFVGNGDFIDSFEGTVDEKIQKMISEIPEFGKRFSGEKIEREAQEIEAYAIASKQLFGPGYVITGNSSEFIDPIFSSGVTMATKSGALAARLLNRELNNEQVDWQAEYSDYLKKGVDTFKTFVNAWYDGSLQEIFFYSDENVESREKIRRQICSVLAGYVWDDSNPFVRKHERAIASLASVVRM